LSRPGVEAGERGVVSREKVELAVVEQRRRHIRRVFVVFPGNGLGAGEIVKLVAPGAPVPVPWRSLCGLAAPLIALIHAVFKRP
jgi:hypothetical protein